MTREMAQDDLIYAGGQTVAICKQPSLSESQYPHPEVSSNYLGKESGGIQDSTCTALTTAPWHSVNPHKYFLSHYLSYYPGIPGRVWPNLTTKQDEFWLEPHSVEDRLLNCYVCPDSSEVDPG